MRFSPWGDRVRIGASSGSMALFWSAANGSTTARALLAGALTLGLAYGAARYRKGLGRAAVGAAKGARWGYRKARPLLGGPVTSQEASKPRLWHPVNRVRWHGRRKWKRTKARWRRKLTPKVVVRYRKNRDAWRRYRARRT